MLSTTWYYEEQMLSMAFVLLSTPRKSSDFAECQISVSKRVVFYLLGPSSGPWPTNVIHVTQLGLFPQK